MSSRVSLDAGLAALIAFATLVVSLTFRRPPVPSDHMHYFAAAQSFPEPPGHGQAYWQYLRIGLVIPLRLTQEILGANEATYYLVPIAFSMMLAVALYALGALLFGRIVGIGAVILMLGNSIIFPEMTQLLPDLGATAQFVAAVALAVAIRQERAWVSGSARRRILALLAVGFLLGWSYLTREFIVFCWPLVPLVLWWRVPGVAGWAWLKPARWVAAPMAACLALELFIGARYYSSPFTRMKVVTGHGHSEYADQVAGTFRDKPRMVYVKRFWSIIGDAPDGRALQLALVIALVGALFAPRRLGWLALWMALLWFPLTMLGGFIDPSAPKLRLQKDRYWLPIYPAIALGASATLALVGRQLLDRVGGARGPSTRRLRSAGQRTGVAVVAVCALLIPVAAVGAVARSGSGANGYSASQADHLPEFRGWLSAHRDEVGTLWVDSRTRQVLPLYIRGRWARENFWRGNLRILKSDRAGIASGDYVLQYSKGPEVCGYCRGSFEGVFGRPPQLPPEWQVVFRTGSDQLQVYRVP